MPAEPGPPPALKSDESSNLANKVPKDSNLPTASSVIPARTVMFRGSAIMVPVTIMSTEISAVIDTAAEATVISTELFEQLSRSHTFEKGEKVILGNAEQKNYMEGLLVPGLRFTLGKVSYTWDIVVAPISDSMLLGADFLMKNNSKIDIAGNCLELNGSEIVATHMKNPDGDYVKISRVTVEKRTVIPPNCMKHVPVRISNHGEGDFVVEPVNQQADLLLGAGVLSPKQPTFVTYINDSDKFRTLKRGHYCGNGVEVDEVFLDPSNITCDSFDVKTVEVTSSSSSDTGEINSSKTSTSEPDLDKLQTTDDLLAFLPEHVKSVFTRISETLTFEQKKSVALLLNRFSNVFSKHEFDLGHFDLLEHEITLHDPKPFKERMRRTPLGFQQEEEKTLNHMLEAGVIQPSSSPFASAPVLVRKRDGGVRYCIDYRLLNSKTVKDCFPLPLIEECLDTLSGCLFFSTVDMASGYWQILLKQEDRAKTAFVTKYGLFEHVRMGFGLTNAPATFCRAMSLVLRGLTYNQVLAYLDDVVVLGRSFDEHLSNLEMVLQRFQDHNLKLKPKKCHVFQTEIDFLGRKVNGEGLSIQDDKIETVRNWPIPKSKSDLASFLGTVNYHRDFIADYAKIAEPLYGLLKPKTNFDETWTEDHVNSFSMLKQAMISSPVLALPNTTDTFILDCDASNFSIGAELNQLQDGQAKVIAYSSFVLTPAQRRYCTTRKELLALITFCRHFRHYLIGRRVIVRTDHASLTWLMRFKKLEGQLARWCEELSQYDLMILHRGGAKHQNADGLSRIPVDDYCDCYEAGKSLQSLPCKGCAYCTKCHQQWSRFEEDVDDVVPIGIRRIGLELVDPDELPDLTTEITTFEKYSSEDLRDLQLKDPDLKPIITWLESDSPSEAELFRQGLATKFLWSCRSQLQLVKGVLYYRWEFCDHSYLKLVVPESLKTEVLQLTHDNRIGGHYGRDKTVAKTRSSFFWFGLRRDVILHVETCDICLRNKKRTRIPRSELGDYQAGYRLERVHLDILGPFVTSERGYKYILMITDQFTKFVLPLPLADQTAESIAKIFFDQFITLFGCPTQIHTDQGKNFDSNYFKALCELLQIAKTRTTPYRPSSNGQVETYNRVILRFLRSYLDGKQQHWDRYISSVGMSLRASVSASTGFTPNFLMFGEELSMPAHVLLGLSDANHQTQSCSEHVKEMVSILQKSFSIVRQNLQKVQKRQKTHYDVKVRRHVYQIGDLVYKLDQSTVVGESKKLRPIYKGPMMIEQVLSDSLYKVTDRKKSFVLHHDKLIPCTAREIPLWLRRKRSKLLDESFSDSSNSLPDSSEDSDDVLTDMSTLFAPDIVDVPLDVPLNAPLDIPLSVPSVGADDVIPIGIDDNDDVGGFIPSNDVVHSDQVLPRTTRGGRVVKPPSHLKDYDMS